MSSINKTRISVWEKSKIIYYPWVTPIWSCGGKGYIFFCWKTNWKTHRIVDAELDKLGIALDINDNDKSEFSESDEKDENVVYKVVISISCYLFEEF